MNMSEINRIKDVHVKNELDYVMHHPQYIEPSAQQLLKACDSFLSDKVGIKDFSIAVMTGVAEHFMRVPMTSQQRLGLLKLLSTLSDAVNPEYSSVHHSSYCYFAPTSADMTGEESALNMLDITKAYFKDFDINTKAEFTGSTLMSCALKQLSVPNDYKLEAIKTYIKHGADIHLSHGHHGTIMHMLDCTDIDTPTLLVGFVEMGADPFAECLFHPSYENPFKSLKGYEQYRFKNYMDYVKDVYEIDLEIKLETSVTKTQVIDEVHDYLQRLQLSYKALKDCNQSSTTGKRKSRSVI